MAQAKKTAGKKKAVTKAGPAKITKVVTFALFRTTKGACVYSETDDKGKIIDTKELGFDAALIGTTYARKGHLGCNDETAPKKVTATYVFE